MDVKVIIKKWGNYNQGDILSLPDSTAIACIKSGAVESVGNNEEVKSPKKEVKKK